MLDAVTKVGEYMVHSTLTLLGGKRTQASLNGPFALTVKPGAAAASSTEFSVYHLEATAGEAIEDDHAARQLLEPEGRRRRRGERLRRGGATLAPGPGQEVSVRDSGDGSYAVTYVVPYSGKHTLAVLLGNKAIKGSPFTIEVHPAP